MINIDTRIKELFKKETTGSVYNNVRIIVEDGTVIENDHIVGESLKMTERICSSQTLKFGVCEAKTLEIECFDIENIKGKNIKVNIEKVKDGDVVGIVPYGDFHVSSCKKDAVSGCRQIVAYDAMKSSTLDKDMHEVFNERIEAGQQSPFEAQSIFQIEREMLKKLGLNKKETKTLETKWYYGTTSENWFDSDEKGYHAYVKRHYLDHEFEKEKYYRFMIPAELQEKRLKRIQDYLDRSTIKFSGSDAFWLNQLCYMEINDGNGHSESFIGDDKKEYTNVSRATIYVASRVEIRTGTQTNYSTIRTFDFGYEDALQQAIVYELKLNAIERARLKTGIESVTLRNILESMYEMKGKFGRINRETGEVEDISLNNGAIHPLESLFPHSGLHPSGAAATASNEIIENAWFSENEDKKIGIITINYLTEKDGKSEKAIYTKEFDESANGRYEVKGNWILDNIAMTEEEIDEIANEMIEEIRGVEITAFSARMIGLPYIEAGDMIEIADGNTRRKCYIFERTITGIQGMEDEMSALGGDE